VPTAGKAGIRVIQGQVVLTNVNGVDSGETWGVFGSEIADGDAEDVNAMVSMIGCNLEDFTSIGLWVKRGSKASIFNTSFIAPASGSNLQALYYANTNQNDPIFWGVGNRWATKGATWKNSNPLHAKLGPGVVSFGNDPFVATVYSDLAGYTVQTYGVTGLDANSGTILKGGFRAGLITVRARRKGRCPLTLAAYSCGPTVATVRRYT
jgi:hypothetical protein